MYIGSIQTGRKVYLAPGRPPAGAGVSFEGGPEDRDPAGVPHRDARRGRRGNGLPGPGPASRPPPQGVCLAPGLLGRMKLKHQPAQTTHACRRRPALIPLECGPLVPSFKHGGPSGAPPEGMQRPKAGQGERNPGRGFETVWYRCCRWRGGSQLTVGWQLYARRYISALQSFEGQERGRGIRSKESVGWLSCESRGLLSLRPTSSMLKRLHRAPIRLIMASPSSTSAAAIVSFHNTNPALSGQHRPKRTTKQKSEEY